MDAAKGQALRASDADREAVVAALRAHCEAGRVRMEELEERTTAALAATTLGELDSLLADLPGGRPRTGLPASQPQPVQAGPPGLRSFEQRHELPIGREQAFREAAAHVVPRMVSSGWDVIGRVEPELLAFECESRPAWVYVMCVIFFPLGLLALLVHEKQRVAVTFEERGPEKTVMFVQGFARRNVRKAFAEFRLDQ